MQTPAFENMIMPLEESREPMYKTRGLQGNMYNGAPHNDMGHGPTGN